MKRIIAIVFMLGCMVGFVAETAMASHKPITVETPANATAEPNPEQLKQARETNACPGCNLRGASLAEGALKPGANLAGADLTGANLTAADLRGANLTGADLRGASLSFTYLRGADLTGADLRGADLRSTNLAGADLTGVNVTKGELYGLYLGFTREEERPRLCHTQTPWGEDNWGCFGTENSMGSMELPELVIVFSLNSNEVTALWPWDIGAENQSILWHPRMEVAPGKCFREGRVTVSGSVENWLKEWPKFASSGDSRGRSRWIIWLSGTCAHVNAISIRRIDFIGSRDDVRIERVRQPDVVVDTDHPLAEFDDSDWFGAFVYDITMPKKKRAGLGVERGEIMRLGTWRAFRISLSDDLLDALPVTNKHNLEKTAYPQGTR